MMCPAEWFWHEFINQTEGFQFTRTDTHGLRRLGREGFVTPEDGCSCLRRSDGIDGMFQHQNAIGYANRQRTPASPFANYGGDNRDTQARHQVQVGGDGLRLTAFLVGQTE